MTFQAWGSAAVLIAASVVIGYGLCALGVRCRAAGPAVGLAILIIVAYVTIRLPGHGTMAAVILLVLVLAAAGLVIVRRRKLEFPAVPLLAGSFAAVGAAVPFVANGRVGLLGVSLDNDTSAHLRWAEALRSTSAAKLYPLPGGYPLGPHSLVAALGSGLHVRLDLVFTGFLISTVVVTALVASRALVGSAVWKQVVVGLGASLLYLSAAYYAEGAFKELLVALMLLAIALHLEEVQRDWGRNTSVRWAQLVPVSLLAAAAIYVFSYPAIGWIALTLGIWIVAEIVARPARLRTWRGQLRRLLPASTVAAVAAVVLVIPIAGRISYFAQEIGTSPAGTGAIAATNLGNLVHGLSPYEALGIWNSQDFRLFPPNVFHAGELSALAVGVLLLGIAWCLARRELLFPAALAACGIVWYVSNHGQSPYVAAKALVVAGPIVAVIAGRGLLQSPTRSMPRPLWAARFLAAIAFIVFAGYSSFQALRDEPVWPAEPTRELFALGGPTRGQTLLFLGTSDYVGWIFEHSRMSALIPPGVSLEQAHVRANKAVLYGTGLDFDSVQAADLNRFRWVITTNSPYASQPPAGMRLAQRLAAYELWERVGPIGARSTIEPPGAPGAMLDCRTAAGRALSRRRGIAAVMPRPLVVKATGIAPGGSERITLPLPSGRWELSAQYLSAVAVQLSAAGRSWHLQPYLDRPGPWFAVGSVTSTGTPLELLARASKPSAITGPYLAAQLTAIAATRIPDVRALIPLSRGCGRYIDWYRFT